MGEIKSTMDIIMEKAKAFSVSEEEKKAIKDKDFEERVRSLVNRFLEVTRGGEDLLEELKEINKRRSILKVLFEECRKKITLESDNGRILELIGEFRPDVSEIIKGIIDNYFSLIKNKRTIREKELIDELAREGITGSAITVNLNADKEWKKLFLEIHKDFDKEIQETITERGIGVNL